MRAGAAVLAVNSAAARFPGYRLSLAVASSHIVLTEPIPDVLDELGWTGGEAIVDSRTLVHYTRTTRDGRIVFGWGGGAMGLGGRIADRLELDRDVVARDRASLRRFFPQTRGREVTHAWGGPIDVSPTHLPIFGSRGRVHHGFGFTGNGVGPVVPRRRDPRAPRARPPRREDALAIVEPAAEALPARAVPLRRRLAHPPRADGEGRRGGRGSRAERADALRGVAPAPPRPPPSALARTTIAAWSLRRARRGDGPSHHHASSRARPDLRRRSEFAARACTRTSWRRSTASSVPLSVAWRSIARELVVGEAEAVERRDVVLELRDARGADQRRGDALVAQHPGERHLRERLAPRGGDRRSARGSCASAAP